MRQNGNAFFIPLLPISNLSEVCCASLLVAVMKGIESVVTQCVH